MSLSKEYRERYNIHYCNSPENIAKQTESFNRTRFLTYSKLYSFKYNMIIAKGFKRKIYNLLWQVSRKLLLLLLKKKA